MSNTTTINAYKDIRLRLENECKPGQAVMDDPLDGPFITTVTAVNEQRLFSEREILRHRLGWNDN